MSGFLTVVLVVFLTGFVRAEDPVVDLPVKMVEVKFREASWFDGVTATATVALPEMVEEPETRPQGGNGVSLISLEVLEAKEGKGSVVVIQWLPEGEGLAMFPELEFDSVTTRYRSAAKQVLVSVPRRSSEMELSIKPGKTRLYAGEPLRLDVEWTCRVPTKRLRSMNCYPEFFNDPKIEIVVPRSTVPEERQMGMPFGGRRVIAEREGPTEGEGLGVVSFAVFLRINEAGTYILPAVHLECARLKREGGAFAPYAAYFNNGLFDPISEGEAFERVFVESEPIEIEVLALPGAGRLESFSGLFAPCRIEVSAKPTETEVGQLVELDLLVRSDAPHGFLNLPELTKQRALRSWFKVDPEYGRAWHPEGTEFRARVRPLTVQVKELPPLEFEIFDPEKGEYQVVKTDGIPLRILPRDGRDYFDAKALGEDGPSLSDTPDGIWQNVEINPMDEILNKLVNFLANYFWLLLMAGPLMFGLLLPWAKESRRRALSPAYRKRQQAYAAFKRLPEGGVEKWRAFREFVAMSLGIEPAAWTAGDARSRLVDLGVAEQDVNLMVRSQESLDEEIFSEHGTAGGVPELNEVAKRIAKVISQSAVVMLMIFLAGSAMGADWNQAAETFDRALEAEVGSEESVSMFTESALIFEACARDGELQGKAWLNAGNAWFQAGEIGRSIACYRQAEIYRPFDKSLRDNLSAARALAVDVVENRRTDWWLRWPWRWIAAVLIPVSFVFWLACLGYARFRHRGWLIAMGILLVASLGLASLCLLAKKESGREGVVVVPEVFGRKGPSYRYQTAFNEALHDGLEVRITERRDGWVQVELTDERLAWVPESQLQVIVR